MYKGNPLLQRVIEINLILLLSLDLEQRISALCLKLLIKLIFCLVRQKESQRNVGLQYIEVR